jgi:putative membrane protein
MQRYATLLLVAVAGAWSSQTLAAAPEPGSRQTRDFVQGAGQSDAFERLEAETVLATTRDPDIRAFAEHMIHDHGETTQALEAATARAGLQPPPKAMSSDQASMLAALQSVRGHDFDVAYLRQQVIAHSAALVVEQQYAQSGDDTAVRQAAASAVPLIAAHLAMAEQLRAKLGGS